MLKENQSLDKFLSIIKSFIPKNIFKFFQPFYHGGLSLFFGFLYNWPSRKLKIIGVTGTKGKSTTVFLISKLLEESGKSVAAIGSLGYKIKTKEWPNNLKMTMPGRGMLQKFLHEALKAGCEYVVLEVTSEGLAQNRDWGINFDCAIFTNLSKEHIESHGSFDNYYRAKQKLFKKTKNIHVFNTDDLNVELFSKFKSKRKIFYGIQGGDMRADNIKLGTDGSSFEIYGDHFIIHLGGKFNIYNCLAALAATAMYGVDLPTAKPILEAVKTVSGRMEFINRNPDIVIDYAHTPDSLEKVYKTLGGSPSTWFDSAYYGSLGTSTQIKRRLICVLGAAGGGRDKWKRHEFGKIADEYCDYIILTNEDPFDEDPVKIISDIKSGISTARVKGKSFYEIIERGKAIKKALTLASSNDTVIITGKGSETSIAVSDGKKISWNDKEVTLELLKGEHKDV